MYSDKNGTNFMCNVMLKSSIFYMFSLYIVMSVATCNNTVGLMVFIAGIIQMIVFSVLWHVVEVEVDNVLEEYTGLFRVGRILYICMPKW